MQIFRAQILTVFEIWASQMGRCDPNFTPANCKKLFSAFLEANISRPNKQNGLKFATVGNWVPLLQNLASELT